MLFNSAIFVLFFLVVYTVYLASHRRFRVQNYLLVVASYVFYGYWDPRFLVLIFVSTVIYLTPTCVDVAGVSNL
jgi:alginate O-acetyltransferase complex protein AlgI